MLEAPKVHLRLLPDDRWSATGPHGQRAMRYARQWCEWHQADHIPPHRIDVLSAPPLHVGLGVGTQLALAVAYALHRASGVPVQSRDEVAQSVGRGRRSAVGIHGFAHGGLIWEKGKRPEEPVSPLVQQLALPEPWRIVVVRPEGISGLHGDPELQAFDRLPPVPHALTRRMTDLVESHLLPAVRDRDFSPFARAVGQLGQLAGSAFASLQGGPYNGPGVRRLVDWLRARGVDGVGQSSWGPTVFAIVSDPPEGERLREELQRAHQDVVATLTRPSPSGATIWEESLT